MEKRKSATQVYEIEISLKDIKPRIWRRFAVPGNLSLASLHDVIQCVMGWRDSHLHKFLIAAKEYWPRYQNLEPDGLDERKAVLSKALSGLGTKFLYEYDFGDCWTHELIVKKIGQLQIGTDCPLCLGGQRACPPEDCGGIWGYENLLATIADPNHEEHQGMMEWLGGEFDPNAFDISEINQRLQNVASNWRMPQPKSSSRPKKSGAKAVRPKTKHYFFLNPYIDCAFSKCPKCETPTKIRKFPLVIHIEPHALFVLNKKCRFCTGCDLIIASKSEIESMMAASFENTRPEIIGNECQVVGTLDHADWRKANKERLDSSELVEYIHIFVNILNFEMIPGGWYPDKKG